jgi:hypothetical protein
MVPHGNKKPLDREHSRSYLHPDVRREGNLTDFLVKDHLNSNRVTLRMGGLTTPQSYGPYGQPKNQSLPGKG